MADNRNTRRKAARRDKKWQRPISRQERQLLNRHMRQVYIWRYQEFRRGPTPS